ncbi:MAG: hypothetical protein HGB01_03550 [Chlorobiaceae bacterium]|nr:hypothetical protein [Chlorobiales bacterium]NTU90293.1 hypothetical protein [Chlorobiaceae bacterium]NTV25272.1 hypothetical protein [Chlorobiaceae bacterium]
MANNGVFSDLFNAVGTPVQNVADIVGSGFNTALSLAESCVNVCSSLVTSTANTAIQLIQGVSSALNSIVAPKQ